MASISRWLNDPEESSFSSYSLGNRSRGNEDFTPRHLPNISFAPAPASQISHTTESHSRCADTVFSKKSSKTSTTATSQSTIAAVPWHIQVQTQANAPLSISQINSGNVLPCEFVSTGCNINFHTDDVEAWINHSITHFGVHPPPPKTICLFCNDEFETDHDPEENWRARMQHNLEHFLDGRRNVRPDFFVLDYMRQCGLMSIEDWNKANEYTERPLPEGIVRADIVIPEMTAQRERESRIPDNLQKQDRERRKGKLNNHKRKG